MKESETTEKGGWEGSDQSTPATFGLSTEKCLLFCQPYDTHEWTGGFLFCYN